MHTPVADDRKNSTIQFMFWVIHSASSFKSNTYSTLVIFLNHQKETRL